MSLQQENIYKDPTWKSRISHPAQVGGIETSVIDNGPGKGTRIAWINTGGGLRLKVVPDRAMDITDAFMNAYALAWISHHGTVPPLRSANYGIEWLRAFGGGLMTTCGLDHVGGPEDDEYGRRGLHGEVSNTSAEIIAVNQPDLDVKEPVMSITGRILQSTVFGPHLELTRTISARLGRAEFDVQDRVRNVGNQPTPHMLLYHLNFGWPLVDEGSQILWEGDWEARNSDMDRNFFNSGRDIKVCSGILDEHSGTGEAALFIDPSPDQEGLYHFGISNPKLGLTVTVSTRKDQLPALTNWQHLGLREYVVGLEPGTHHPIGQTVARSQGKLIMIQPGESYHYQMKFTVDQK